MTVAAEETVQGDLIASAGTGRIDGRVDGDLIFGAGRMQMDGAVAGSVLGSTGGYTRGGSVGGSERVNVGQPEEEQGRKPPGPWVGISLFAPRTLFQIASLNTWESTRSSCSMF